MLKLHRVFLLFLILTSTLWSQNIVRSDQVAAQLVSEVESIRPATPFTVALRLEMDPHWHVYWINPGDAGLAPEIEWNLPEGFSAGEIQWPFPERIPFSGLLNFGYEDELLLLVDITPPADLADSEVTLKAETTWLVCKESCIPEDASLELKLAVNHDLAQPNSQWVEAFSKVRAQLPIKNSEWTIQAAINDTTLSLLATPPASFEGSMAGLTFFPYDSEGFDIGKDQQFAAFEDGYRLDLPLLIEDDEVPESINGILVANDGWRGAGAERSLNIDVPVTEKVLGAIGAAASGDLSGIWWALFSAFVGGMILNVMPCVLPVLSLKILGFVEQAGEDSSSVFKHGLVFMFGVLASFWVLAGILIALQAGGEQLGWGFHLQSPIFVVVLIVFLFLFGLSLFGVFEIGTSLMGVGQGAEKSGFTGSFMSGVTATVVATPCTAPFMGAALGYALSQPPWVSMMIFTFLGLGMAFPYVLLSSSPALLKFVPRPGVWMESLKQFMGFLLMATVVWLLKVLGDQSGLDTVMIMLVSLVIIAIGGWVLGRWGNIARETKTRLIGQVLATALVVGGLAFFFMLKPGKSVNPIEWQDFAPGKVEELRQLGKPVFVDFTASWCLSCQANKKFAIETDEVEAAFKEMGVNAVMADWTSRDADITKALAEFGRNSVPLYVLYSADGSKEPIILPEILTPGILLDALDKLN
ncbi:MAG: protein-disulfide reductase DsbD family protein [Calditrichia bacterium]